MTTDPKDPNAMASDDHDLLITFKAQTENTLGALTNMLSVLSKELTEVKTEVRTSMSSMQSTLVNYGERLVKVETKLEEQRRVPNWVYIASTVAAVVSALVAVGLAIWHR